MKNILTKICSLVLVLFVTFAVVGCNKPDPTPEPKDEVTFTFEADKTTLVPGESVNLTVTVTGLEDTTCNFMVSNDKLVKVENNVLTVIGDVEADTAVTVIAYPNADPSKSKQIIFTVQKEVVKSVEITTQRNTITFGETIKLNVVTSGFTNSAYAWVYDTELLTITDNVLSVVKEVSVDTKTTIKAVSVEDNSVYAEKEITIKAPSSLASIQIIAAQDTIAEGETIMVSALVVGLADQTYTWSVSDPSLIEIKNGFLTLIGTVKVDKNVTITCTANGDESVFASKTITIKAPIVDGQVGELTQEILAEIANPSITVNGVVTDYYNDFNNSFNNSTKAYDYVVMMSEGRWYGAWNVKGDTSNIIADNYRKGTEDGIRDQYGNYGHALERLYINKNNEVASKYIKDYMSIPAVWEAQHLWNHLSNLDVNRFVHDVNENVYVYTLDVKSEDDLYLMTYLSVSLTPMLSDTLAQLKLTIEDGHITKLVAQTEVLYYGSETREEADAMSYTEVEMTFANIGSTVVPEPSPYTAPENAELLEAAIEKMKKLTNYTYSAKDTTTYAPSGDAGDYEMDTLSASFGTGTATVMSLSANAAKLSSTSKIRDYTSAVGTVGEVGRITSDAILVEKTGKYSYSIDDKLYYTNYTGFKQNEDGTYDEFKYSSDVDAFIGTRKVSGEIIDLLPNFDFSAYVFEYEGTKNGNHIFTLREGDITRDLAMEVSMHSYSKDAEQSTSCTLTVVVSPEGYIVETKYAYNLTDVYYGIIDTKYSNFETTELPEYTFNGYVPREWKTSWSQYDIKYYSPSHSSRDPYVEASTQEVFDKLFGIGAVDIPTPDVFLAIFGDLLYGPFFDYKESGVDAEGNTTYIDYVSINTQSSEYDENSRITNYEELMNELITALQELGYTLDESNTDTSGGETGLRDRYVCLYKGNVEIVITNNHTKHLSIYFYQLGDWILK